MSSGSCSGFLGCCSPRPQSKHEGEAGREGELCLGAVLPISQHEASSHKIRHFGTSGTPRGEFLLIRALHLVVGCLSWDLLPEPTTAQLPQGGVSVPR